MGYWTWLKKQLRRGVKDKSMQGLALTFSIFLAGAAFLFWAEKELTYVILGVLGVLTYILAAVSWIIGILLAITYLVYVSEVVE